MSAKVIILTVKSEDPSDVHLTEKSFGSGLEKIVRSHGGKCIAKWTDGRLLVVVQGISSQLLRPYLDAYVDCQLRHQRHVTITQVETDAAEGLELPDSYTGPGAIRREKLTRKLLMTLPAGLFVVSNLYPNGRSAFAEKIGSPETRLAAWKRAVAAGASQRLCEILSTEDEFIKAKCPTPGLSL